MSYQNQAAIDANRRLERQRDIYSAGEPTRSMHDTLKEIKVILSEILELMKQNGPQ